MKRERQKDEDEDEDEDLTDKLAEARHHPTFPRLPETCTRLCFPSKSDPTVRVRGFL